MAQGSQNNITQNLNYFIDWLQQQTPPRFLTGVIKTYIKESLKLGASEQQILQYIIGLADRVPVEILDPVTRKLVQKTAISILSPDGVQQRSPKPKALKNQKQNTNQNVLITIPTNLTNTTGLTNPTRFIVTEVNATPNINELNQNTMIIFSNLQSPTTNNNVPLIASPRQLHSV